MAVAVHADAPDRPGLLDHLLQPLQQVAGQAVIGGLQGLWDEMAADEIDAVDAIALQVDARPVAEAVSGPY